MKPPTLIILRGPSGAGKSSVAKKLREKVASKTALIEQDYIRRIVLGEKDTPSGVNAELIRQTAEFALSHGYNVILEGILYTKNYQSMLAQLIEGHGGSTFVYYFDISFQETVRRHATKPNSHEFGADQMRDWYKDKDLLGIDVEQIISQESTLEQSVGQILVDTEL